jgi:hypothetical protein
MVQAKLPLFRMLTVVRLGDGKHTSFCHDKGMLSSTLVEVFPVLYSHTITSEVLVYSFLTQDQAAFFCPRLTHTVSEEKRTLQDCLLLVTIWQQPDHYFLVGSTNFTPSTRLAYIKMHEHDPLPTTRP